MIIPLSFYALVYYRFRCIVERPVDEIGLAPVLHFNDNVLTCVSFAKDVEMIPRWSFVSGNISLSLNFTSVICCSPKSSWFKNSISKSLLYSWPKIRLNDQSENGLMYLAISLRFYVLVAKIRFSFVTSKKLTKKVFVGGRGEGDK